MPIKAFNPETAQAEQFLGIAVANAGPESGYWASMPASAARLILDELARLRQSLERERKRCRQYQQIARSFGLPEKGKT